MEYRAFLIKYAEIGLKGKNRLVFEEALMKQMKIHLHRIDGAFTIIREQGRIYVEAQDFDFDEVIDALNHVFGISKICPVVRVNDEGIEKLKKDVVDYMSQLYPDNDAFTFKVETRRINKNFPMHSMEINCALGEAVLDAFDRSKVDVHQPDELVRVEIRDNGINIYSREIPGPGGMPLGTNGMGTLLLSGGIDSPVAGYMIARRGVKIDAVYFHAPPHTSERAKEKVIDLAKIVSKYTGPIKLHVVNFTDIQMAIYEKCPHDELTIIMRRYMMRIAQHIAEKEGSLGLITGENIGQVASQTMWSMAVTNEVCSLPVYRPLIGFDKEEIVTVAKKLGTYETSILPFEDCCTIFVAKHPVTKPRLEVIERSEHHLDDVIDRLMEETLNSIEVIWCGCCGKDSEE